MTLVGQPKHPFPWVVDHYLLADHPALRPLEGARPFHQGVHQILLLFGEGHQVVGSQLAEVGVAQTRPGPGACLVCQIVLGAYLVVVVVGHPLVVAAVAQNPDCHWEVLDQKVAPVAVHQVAGSSELAVAGTGVDHFPREDLERRDYTTW